MQMHQIIQDIAFIAVVVTAFAGLLYGSRRFRNWLDVRRARRDPDRRASVGKKRVDP
ncbi:MAG: hypothetical protein KJ011_06040 [Burkholderiaceae bacterium]|nr:hypothetical protein [Burkholderiaceae bacterium]